MNNLVPTEKLSLAKSSIVKVALLPNEFNLTVDAPSTNDDPVISTEPVICVLPLLLFLILNAATSKSVSLSCAVTLNSFLCSVKLAVVFRLAVKFIAIEAELPFCNTSCKLTSECEDDTVR